MVAARFTNRDSPGDISKAFETFKNKCHAKHILATRFGLVPTKNAGRQVRGKGSVIALFQANPLYCCH